MKKLEHYTKLFDIYKNISKEVVSSIILPCIINYPYGAVGYY